MIVYTGSPVIIDKDTQWEKKTSYVIMPSGTVYDILKGGRRLKAGKFNKNGKFVPSKKYNAKYGARLKQLDSNKPKESNNATN